MKRGAKSISTSRLMYDLGSPGAIFKLTESILYDAIETVSKSISEIELSDTAGVIQFSFTEEPKQLAYKVLNSYYDGKN